MKIRYLAIITGLVFGLTFVNFNTAIAQKKDHNKVIPKNPNIPLIDFINRVPGVIVMNQGGQPRVMLRGSTTLTGNNRPLFVVDGYYLETFEQLENAVDVVNIAEINVLKGIQASDRYGMRASNGAIVIKTVSN